MCIIPKPVIFETTKYERRRKRSRSKALWQPSYRVSMTRSSQDKDGYYPRKFQKVDSCQVRRVRLGKERGETGDDGE